MKVLILSQVFPAYHPRAGERTGFREKRLSGEKIHTIRLNEKGYYKDGDVVSVREWTGKPYRSKQRIIQDGVKIGVQEIFLPKENFRAPIITIPYVTSFPVEKETLAKNDGLSLLDFNHWFYPQGKPRENFRGSLIYFTDFRYGDT